MTARDKGGDKSPFLDIILLLPARAKVGGFAA